MFVGKNGLAKNIPKVFAGVNNTAREVKYAYVGVEGIARLIFLASGKEVGEVGMTARSVAPTNCYLLPVNITQVVDPTLYSYAQAQIALGNQLFILNANQTITIRNPQFPVGRIANDADFGVLGRTGGVRTVTLTAAQMPSHTHTQNAHNHGQDWHNHGQDAHNHAQNPHTHAQNPHRHQINGSVSASYSFPHVSGAAQRTGHRTQATTATNNYGIAGNYAVHATNHGVTVANHANTATNNNTGGGGAHTNLPPYTVVNYWIYRGQEV